MVYLTVSLFIDAINEPVALIIGQGMIFGSDLGDTLTITSDGWPTVAYKITGFMCAIICLVLSSYISYYKSVVKVDALLRILKISTICLWTFLGVGLTNSIFVAYFSISEKVVPISLYGEYEKLHTKNVTSGVIAIIIQVIFFALEFTCFFIL